MKFIVNEVQMISEAISSAIKIDVTVVDLNLERIAGTGRYKKKIGEKVAVSSVFGYSLNTGETYIVENPKEDIVCESCEHRAKCSEFAELCCPIIKNGVAVGVIGLIAFNEIQKKSLIENNRNLIRFLEKMAELISTKLCEIEKTEEIKKLLQEIEVILNTVDNGIIATDADGKILHYNAKALKMFGLDKNMMLNHSILEILPNILICKCISEGSGIYNQEFHYKKGNIDFRGIYDAKALISGKLHFGILFSFNNVKEIIKRVNNLTLSNIETRFEDIIGQSSCLEKVKKDAMKASKSTSTVLIQGESGTGKELFARAIHFHSDRANKPFITINCAAIPEQLLESELFGYESGAFTGAKKGGKSGKFELAHKGTIFLDEIGELPLHLQSKLLRVLQEKVIEKVGGEEYISLDVRIIAATNRNLEQSVKDGEFREDLYYRLNVILLNIPPLRNRSDDLDIVLEYILKKFNAKLGKNILGITDKCKNVLREYKWPGNIRELENTLEYSMNMTNKEYIELEDLPNRIKETRVNSLVINEEISELKTLEKKEMIKALEIFKACDKPVEKAAKALGIGRATMYRKIKEYDICLVK